MKTDHTLDYYEQNAESFVLGTREVSFAETQNRFLSYLKPEARILDFGCGSGRDTRYFISEGYQVDAIDGSRELCRIASEYTGITVRCMRFEELDVEDWYDGIWACASILHLSKTVLPSVLQKMSTALHENGVIYTSFKNGTFEGERNGRFFSDYNEESLKELVSSCPELHIEELWITSDVREGREDEKWLNTIIRRQTSH